MVTLGDSSADWYSRSRGLSGLANAVLVAAPNSPFLTRWYNMYKTFDYRQWDFHSCKLPMLLAYKYPHEVVTLATAGFFLPQAEQMASFFTTDEWDFGPNWGVHLWHHIMNATFSTIQSWSREDIMSQRSSFGRLARAAWANTGETIPANAPTLTIPTINQPEPTTPTHTHPMAMKRRALNAAPAPAPAAGPPAPMNKPTPPPTLTV